MRIIVLLPLFIAACSTGESAFVGSPHGYQGSIDTTFTSAAGVPTILQEGESPLQAERTTDRDTDMVSTYMVRPDGSVTATGFAAEMLAKAQLCRSAPAPECGASVQ